MIYEYLQDNGAVGAENAMYKAVLSRYFGMTDDGIKRAVNNEREQGYPIDYSNRGYYIPANRAENDECCERLRREGYRRIKTARALETAYNAQNGQQGGQLSMFGNVADTIEDINEQ